ncbi:hypothetical protein ASC97_04105 [Rhizobium sp. Root1203]|uniref:hypothetical protein n=1 Tax=Rhizobium sp. Root1203 TaxID=1736427 RepID=UPI00070B9658|nr:hypothetical protein [Rhizobium sp. Root1203]KQV27570.1 hypothetical protein ASC97_04105 [Rhizobium sp. Root1203]
MKIIRDSQALVGMLEGGELNKEFSSKLQEVLTELADLSNDSPKATFKGALTLKLDFAVANGMVTINADVATKTPKRPRRASVYWVTEGGALSTEHPQQHDMFSPREVSRQTETA